MAAAAKQQEAERDVERRLCGRVRECGEWASGRDANERRVVLQRGCLDGTGQERERESMDEQRLARIEKGIQR